MTLRLAVIGAGGFGRETLDVVDAINRESTTPAFDVIGVLDDNPSPRSLERLAARGVEWLGSIDSWIARRGSEQYLIGVGDPSVRARIAARIGLAGNVAAVAVHPNATIGTMCTIGAGSVICSGVEISTNVSLGRHVHVNPNATIGHDVGIGDFVSINPSATVSGEVSIKREALVGAGAVILPGLRIGANAVVGASACVTRSVVPHMTVKGVPAR